MEIFRNNTWERLCTANWDDAESNLMCMAVGYYNNGPIDNGTRSKIANYSNTPIHRNCTSLTQSCMDNSDNKDQFCNVPVRLNGADVEYGGRVEIFYKGKWGRICPEGWDLNDAKVICKQLGFQSALAEFIGSVVKSENIPFLTSTVSCTGSESDLASCQRTDGEYDCQDDKGAQALCEPKIGDLDVLENIQISTEIRNSEEISCSLKTNATKYIKWYDSVGRPISNTSKIQVSGSTLTIHNIDLSDGGGYQCRGLSYMRPYTIYVNAEFTKTPGKQTLVSGKLGIIDCSAQGAPDPQLEKWSREDGKLLGERRFRRLSNWSLYIDPVHPEDGGRYRCHIKQSKGDRSTTSKHKAIDVSVIVLPEIQLSGPHDIREGDNVTLNCSISGTPKPSVQWYKDKYPVSGGSTTLFLKEVKTEDKGRYTCKAENIGGSDEADIYIAVHIPPKLDHDLQNKSVPLHTTFTMKCIMDGFPSPAVNWTKNGALLPNASNVVTINNASFDDAGLYGCSAQNWVGKARKTVWIDVTVSPQVSVSPKNQTILEGQGTNISCKATGVPKPKITWKFEDGDLPLGVSVSTTEEGSLLKLRNTTKGMEAVYRCTATNKADSANSTVQVHVLEKPTAEVGSNPHPSLMKGDELKLTCKVSESTSEIKWKKDDGPVTSKALITNDDKMSTLVIENVDTDDSGDYSCEAHNKAGFMSSSVEIRVRVSPQVSVSPKNQTILEGQGTNISCNATGVPKPKITWKFKDGDLPLGVSVSTTEEGSLLKLRNTTKGMEGVYRCTATNKADSANSTVTVHVLEKPTAEVGPNPHPTLMKGDELKLTCKVSESTSEIKWKKDHGPVVSKALITNDDKMSTLVIENVDTNDSGDYSCEAHNEAGSASSSVEIRVRASTEGKIFEWYYIVGPLSAVIITALVIWYICKRRMTDTAKAFNPGEEQGYDLEELDHEVDKWEVSRDRIVLREVIGSGAFGVVWKGSLKEPGRGHGRQVIAAKCFTPTSGAEGRKALMREIELGKKLEEQSQPNIITFIGCVTTRIHPILIMEYLPCGDLLGYLRKSRGIEDKYHCGEGEALELGTYDFVSFARQIATGMVFLGSKGIIHRDLAARNILLDRNCVCKITDFGLAYQNFKYGHGNAKKGCIPVKWTAPEILFGNPAALTSQSDVWSYGIVLYEIFTIGTML